MIGETGAVQFGPGEQGVPQIEHVVRGADGDVICRVAGSVDNAERCAAEVDLILLGQNDAVRLYDHVAHPLVGEKSLHGVHEKKTFQVFHRAAHRRLAQRQRHGQMVFLLKIVVVGGVVIVGVGAENTHRGETGALQGVLDLLPLFVKAGVQQNTAACVQLVQGDELPVVQVPGVAQSLFQFHSCVTSRDMIEFTSVIIVDAGGSYNAES